MGGGVGSSEDTVGEALVADSVAALVVALMAALAAVR